jgi:hypothetical protein
MPGVQADHSMSPLPIPTFLYWLAGPLLGLGAWWAEGNPDDRVKQEWDAKDQAIWEKHYSSNRLLMACTMGTFFEFLLAPVFVGLGFSYVNAVGALGCGCLAWGVVFWLLYRPRAVEAYTEFRRFEQLRYGHGVPNIYVVGPGALIGLAWLGYVVWIN